MVGKFVMGLWTSSSVWHIKHLMIHRYSTHFGTVLFVHLGLIFGGLTMLHREEVARNIGEHVINMKLAGEALLNPPKVVREAKRPVAPTAVAAASPDTKPGEIPEVTSSALSGTAIADIKATYMSELRSRIEQNKFFPLAARRMEQYGTVVVAFTLQNDGSIINLRVGKSSGYPRLDSAGLEAVSKVGKFKAIPSELSTSSLDMSVPIKFNSH